MNEYLKQRFLSYTGSVPREEIYIHTDRDEYIAGEYLWFNVYVTGRSTSQLSSASRIAYFELLNSDNRPVVQKRILLKNGSGPGQIVLPDTLSPGDYTIRAYTNWMKNFLPDNCFMKDIRIYNSLKNKPFIRKNHIKPSAVKSGSPDMNSSGITLSVNNQRADSLEIFIVTGKEFREKNSNRIYLFIQTSGLINRVSTEQINSDNTKITVSKKQLSHGINHITIFDSKGHPACERFIFSRERETEKIKLIISDSVNIRSNTNLKVETAYVPDYYNMQNLSISIKPVSSDSESMSIQDYFVFGTEYGQQLLNSIGGRSIKELPDTAIDKLLLNLKSSWIDWTAILSDQRTGFRYLMEKENHQLSGRILKNEAGIKDSSGYILMCSPGKKPGFQYAIADTDGNFSFDLHIDEEMKDLILMSDNPEAASKLIIESSFFNKYPDSKYSPDTTGSPEPLSIQAYSANYQIGKIYNITPLGKPVAPVFTPLKTLGFYGKPDIEILLADYISLPTMEEIFFELVPHVSLKKRRSGFVISIADRIDDNPLNLSPCLLLDGVVINDPALIAGLNPEIVEKIEVIKDIYLVGNYSFQGLVNVVTRSGDFSCVPLSDFMIRLKYRVTDPVFNFPSPDYSLSGKSNIRIPDFRNTLYWDQSIEQDKGGKYYLNYWTSDIPGEYMISIQGILSDGKPVALERLFKVVDN